MINYAMLSKNVSLGICVQRSGENLQEKSSLISFEKVSTVFDLITAHAPSSVH